MACHLFLVQNRVITNFCLRNLLLAGSRTKEILIREEKTVHILRYVNGLQLNDSSKDVVVNLDHSVFESNGVERHFSWVTDIEINNENVYSIAKGGRARWKIENEAFNTLKNQGYEFEHNYGHGNNNLIGSFSFPNDARFSYRSGTTIE